tara:strand:+ start:577 stop:1113 length:537 start_codon:yes stop_codon:yes gene_type:complete
MIEAIFFDRDGVLNEDFGYVHTPEELVFKMDVIKAIKIIPKSTLKFIVTNQSGIARNYYSENEFKTFMNYFLKELRKYKVEFDDYIYCPHHPEFSKKCECRKPNPGMILSLLGKYKLNPHNCIMIGDKISDCVAAKNAEIGHILFFSNKNKFIMENVTFVSNGIEVKNYLQNKLFVQK